MMKLCKIIRIITVAPLAAALAVTLLFLHGGFFANGANFAAAIISLTVFPLLAYPVSIIKKGDERRRFQRSLAIVLAVAGYIGGLLFSLAANAADGERVLYLTYLLSGVAIAFSSFVLKKKSSGHACGIAGPVALLAYYVHPLYLLGLLLLLRNGRKISIDCTGVEDALDVTMAQQTELDYLIYNAPLSYADLILNGDPEEYLKNVAGSHGLED